MKSTKLKLVRYRLVENINESNKQILLDGDGNVSFARRTLKKYKQYF